jgi:PIN domain nuclease of toxin-antitoxin system
MLYARGRIAFGLDHPPLLEALRRIRILPITAEVCIRLRKVDFRSDPADELIAATRLAHDIPLVTRDSTIRTSKLVRFAA